MKTELGQVMEQLLQGKFICRISDEQSWDILNNDDKRTQLDQMLMPLNRTVASAADNSVYFCAYTDLGEGERKVISTQFNDTVASLQPLVNWMVLVQEAASGDEPLTEGVRIRLNEIQTTVEDVPALREQLAKISRYRLFNSTSTAVDSQLKQIFKRLVELGYLIRPNVEKQIYQVTGKIEYLYELLRFIDETEALALEDKADTGAQESLL